MEVVDHIWNDERTLSSSGLKIMQVIRLQDLR